MDVSRVQLMHDDSTRNKHVQLCWFYELSVAINKSKLYLAEVALTSEKTWM